MIQPRQLLIASSCAGILIAAFSLPAAAAPGSAPGLDRRAAADSTLTDRSLTPPVRYMQGRSMGNGKHPSRPRGQKRTGTTSGGPRY